MNWRLRLVDDWRRAWRWSSLWWNGLGLTFNVTAACLLKGVSIAAGFLGFVSLAWLPAIAAAITLLAMAGRVMKKKPKAIP